MFLFSYLFGKKCEPEPPVYAFPDSVASMEADTTGPRVSSICSALEFYSSGSRNDKTVTRKMVTAIIDAQENSEYPLGKTVS